MAGLGLPKLYTAEVEGRLGQFVSFSARLSTALPWTVTITDTTGQVAQGSGFGTNVQWTWDARFATLPGYRWRIGAGVGVRPASGTLGAAGRPAVIQDVSADPAGFTPNGDGKTDTTAIAYELGGPARSGSISRPSREARSRRCRRRRGLPAAMSSPGTAAAIPTGATGSWSRRGRVAGR